MLAISPFTFSVFVIFFLALLGEAVYFFVARRKRQKFNAANEKKRLRDEEEKLHTAVGNATMEFIRAVRKMVNDDKLPPSAYGTPFPYALDLLKWILDKPQISPKKGMELLNPASGEELAMAIAVDIDYALLALSIPGDSIREWVIWDEVCGSQEDFYAKNC